MKKYYKAYDERYKTIHSKGNDWAGDRPTYLLKDWFEKYGINAKSQILEVGCGEGQNALYLQRENFSPLATDVSQEAIRWCKEKAEKQNLDASKFEVLDILDNNLDKKFDCIYSISTLHMLVLDEDRKQFFKFIYEHLSEDGIAIITSMGDGEFEQNKSDINKAFELSERPFGEEVVLVATTSCRIVNWQTILKEAKNANLKVVEHFVSKEVSGFENSMILFLKKGT